MKLMRLPHNYEEASLLCPKCGSIDIRPSRKSAVVGAFFEMLGRRPFRCRTCRIKFYRAVPEHGPHLAL